MDTNLVAARFYPTRHACVSFAKPYQLSLVAECCQSFMLDNGAFTAWKKGGEIDIEAYAEWVSEWKHHPGFDFCIIPDKIDGNEDDNLRLIGKWQQLGLLNFSVPVWHLHESLDVLEFWTRAYPRIALGSSGQYSEPGSDAWWNRMHEAMEVLCREGRPIVKLHGLRMLNPTIFSHIPLSSADSTMIARTIATDNAWTGAYKPVSEEVRAIVLADRIERHAAAARWNRPAYGTQMNLELIG